MRIQCFLAYVARYILANRVETTFLARGTSQFTISHHHHLVATMEPDHPTAAGSASKSPGAARCGRSRSPKDLKWLSSKQNRLPWGNDNDPDDNESEGYHPQGGQICSHSGPNVASEEGESRDELSDGLPPPLSPNLGQLLGEILTHLRRLETQQSKTIESLQDMLRQQDERWLEHLATSQNVVRSLEVQVRRLEARATAHEQRTELSVRRGGEAPTTTHQPWTRDPTPSGEPFLAENAVSSPEDSSLEASVVTPEDRSEQNTIQVSPNGADIDGILQEGGDGEDDEEDDNEEDEGDMIDDGVDNETTDSDATPQRRIVSNLETMLLWDTQHPHSDRRFPNHWSTRAVRGTELDANSSIATRSTATGSTMASTIVTTSVAPIAGFSAPSVLPISHPASDDDADDDDDETMEAGTESSQHQNSFRGNSQSPLTVQSHGEDTVHTSTSQLSSNWVTQRSSTVRPRSSSLRTSLQAPASGSHRGGHRGRSSHSNPLRVVSFTPDTTIVFATRPSNNDEGAEAGVDSIITMPDDVDTEDYGDIEHEPVNLTIPATSSAREPDDDAHGLPSSRSENGHQSALSVLGETLTATAISINNGPVPESTMRASPTFATNVRHWREQYEARLSALERRWPKE